MNKLSILFAFLLVSCSEQKSINPDYEIYSQVISSFKHNSLVIECETRPPFVSFEYNDLIIKLPSLDKETLTDFNDKIKMVDTLKNRFITKKRITLIDMKTVNDIFSDKEYDAWNIFYKRYGNVQGITYFSRIGFNKSMTQAFLVDWTQSDWLGGEGFYSLYERKHNRWVLKYRKLYGMS